MGLGVVVATNIAHSLRGYYSFSYTLKQHSVFQTTYIPIKIMFDKQLEKINSLLNSAKTPAHLAFDSIALISTNVARPTAYTTNAFRRSTARSTPKYSKQITLIREDLSQELEGRLELLFKAKCKDLSIEYNQGNWEAFVRTFMMKNKLVESHFQKGWLNLSDFYLGHSSLPHINALIATYEIERINLTKNTVNPTRLTRITNLKELVLNNCKLGNDALETLFEQLQDSVIQKISLSSPQLKDRNQLTRYDKLITLIKKSSTLNTLELSNIQINPENGILQNCRNTALKHLDLSDNTNVRGICPSLTSLNLSRNGISTPFDFPMVACECQSLNLSYNKIPYYHFKDFLKVNVFLALRHLVLDRLQINGQVYPLQNYIQLSLSLTYLSLVDCDLSVQSYLNITTGIRNSRSVRFLDLTRNRVANEKVSEYLCSMLQSLSLTGLHMRHCDIKDKFGAIIFQGLRKSRSLQRIDMMNNLLGDNTARTICQQLKQAKNILGLELDQNIIKYKDMQQIKSYLEGNKYHSRFQLNQEYGKLNQVNRQQNETDRMLKSEEQRAGRLGTEVDVLQQQFYKKFKVQNELKKYDLKEKITQVRKYQSALQEELFLRQTMMIPTISDDMLSRQHSLLENPQIHIRIPSNDLILR